MNFRVVFPLAAFLLIPSFADAHIELTFPPPRTSGQKIAPCGQSTTQRTNTVTTFEAGETITVTWKETVEHPGHYRIAFDPNGARFADPVSLDDKNGGPFVLVDGIPDKAGPTTYSQTVKLPNVECTNCTLQLIQVMADKPPFGNGDDIYYQCADLVLTAASMDPGPGVDAGAQPPDGDAPVAGLPDPGNPPAGGENSGEGPGGSTGGGGGATDTSPPRASRDDGGCSLGAHGLRGGEEFFATALAGFVWLARKRRRDA